MIYLDNASTSFPKPHSVMEAIASVMKNIGANPGRGGYSAARGADRLVFDTRNIAAGLFGVLDSSRVILTPGGTYSINMALKGLLTTGDHVIAGPRQHNAVERTLADIGCPVSRWNGKPGELKPLTGNRTKAVVVNHASNVDGLLLDLDVVRYEAGGIPLIVDCAQTAGLVPIAAGDNEMFCATGHKGLMGVAGTGLLVLGKNLELRPLISGGTGSFSDDTGMPGVYPDRLEPGSMNLAGIAALGAGISEVLKTGVEAIFKKKMELALSAFTGLKGINGMRIFWPESGRVPLFSFAISGQDPSDIADRLDRDYSIACRAGLHCAPQSHKEIGTFPVGTVRFAPGYFTSAGEIDLFVRSVGELARG